MPGFPKTRGECLARTTRPCPFLTCKFHLWTEAKKTKRGWKLECSRTISQYTCVLDMADRALGKDDAMNTLDDIGVAMGMTREGARQMLLSALESAYVVMVASEAIRDDDHKKKVK